MKFQYIREFIKLAETLNFSRAAEISFITQPALSRHISILEEELGAKLLIRDTRKVELSESGKIVYDAFKEMLSIYNNVQLQVSALSSGLSGALTFSSPYYWTADFTEPLVQRFLEKQPDCDIKVLSCIPTEGLQDVIDGKSDLSICFDVQIEKQNPIIRSVPFATERVCVFVDQKHPLADKSSLRLEDLAGNNFVLMSDDTYPQFMENLKQLLASRGISTPNIHVIRGDQIDMTGMVLQQTGRVGLMLSCLRYMNRSYLRCIPLEDDECLIPLCLFYRMDNTNPLLGQIIRESCAPAI